MTGKQSFQFDEAYELTLKKAFQSFIYDEKFDFGKVRPCVYRSWVRSKEYNVAYNVDAKVPIMNDEQRQKLLRDNNHLISVFHKHVKKIYDVVRSSGYYIFISDKDGWLLDIMTDSDLMSNFDYDPSLVVGASRNEKYVGTNAIGTCLAEGKPLTLWGEEHYNFFHKKYSCAGAPIRNGRGEIIGCISITGLKNTYQDHTLGIVISVVNSIENELNHTEDTQETIHKAPPLTFDNIIGECSEMRKLKNVAKQLAQTDVPILLWGESGSGKEVFANAIHNYSNRAEGPFVAVNCGAIPHELIESELFGYEEGAFTGARKGGRAGIMETASGGTLFLDEIESMPLDAQVKLLRVLSTNRVVRIGSVSEIDVDFRVISASKVDLFDEVDKGNFREDLNYRINTITLRIPPLRDRGDDKEILANYFLKNAMDKRGITDYKIPKTFYDLLDSYDWRGNVRELSNVIEGIAAMTNEGELLNMAVLPERIRDRQNVRRTYGMQAQIKLTEEDYIMKEIENVKGNIKAAANNMGIPRSTLYYKINNSSRLCDYMKKWKVR